MRILVTNDDGVQSRGLWTLVGELNEAAEVTVVAPSRERSAIGTAVTLFNDLNVDRINPEVPGVETYAVDGTPGDCVILALSGLLCHSVDAVVSGINLGPNVGDDVLISGTVAGAMQGYLHGRHALAVSQQSRAGDYLESGARLTARLLRWLYTENPGENAFLNLNVPARPVDEIGGVRVTRLASDTHVNSIRTGDGGTESAYRLVRQPRDNHASPETDVWALGQGLVSITSLHRELFRRSSPHIPGGLEAALFAALRDGQSPGKP
jgi:5'-nucleotidase